MVFIDSIPSSASVDSNPSLDRVASDISNSSVALNIRNEENDEILAKRKKIYDKMDKRATLRRSISEWKAWTWNIWLDNAEVRKSRLVDLATDALLNAWKNPDKIQALKPDDVIKRLVSDANWTNNEKLNAVNNYIRNGWYAENVFNYLVWNTSNVYEKPSEKKDRTFAENALWATLATIPETLAWMYEWVQKKVKYWWKTIYDINKESDIIWLANVLSNVSEDRYQQYKEWWLRSKWYEPYNEAEKRQMIWDIWPQIWIESDANELSIYRSYDEAVKNWFIWNVEEYWQYVYNMANNAYKSISEQTRDYLESELYDPEWKWAWLWKFAWELIEFALMPEMKIKYLKYAPEAAKLEKFLKNSANLIKWGTKLWVEWIKLQALEDAYNAEVSTIWKYATTAVWNMAIWWILKWVWSALWSPSQAAKNALWTKTSKEIEDITNVVKNSIADYNAEITPRTVIRDMLSDARQKLLWNRLTKWEELWTIRNFELKFKDWARYTSKNAIEQDINEALMQQASKKRFGSIAWKKSEIPQFKFTKNWLEISNADVLNNISRNEKWQIVKLWDEIKKVYSETYWAWASMNAATTEKFLRWLDRVFWEEWWSGWPENFINLMKEWISNATKKFDASLTEESLSKLNKARLADKEAIRLDNAFKKIIWNLEWIEWISASEKALWQTATTQELFKAVKKATNGKIDLNNEIWVWVAILSAYDAKAARKIIDNIYPSTPWAMEFVIKSVLWSIKKLRIKQSAKDYTPSSLWKIRENIWWVVSSQM